MDVSSIFSEAFDYTRKLSADLGRLLILIVLDIIPIVNLVVAGYASKVVKESPSSKEPPALRGYVEMWIQGLKVAVAAAIWMIVPIILLVLGFGLGAMGLGRNFRPILGAGILIGILGIIAAFIIAIILSMATVHMIKHDRFGKAFAVGEIIDIIGRIGWGKYILWLVIIFAGVLVLSGIGSIPAIGWLLSLIVGPPFAVLVARTAATIYQEGAPTPSAPAAGARYCARCGQTLTAEAAFCPNCGQKVE